MRVRIQVIKVYSVKVDAADADEAIAKAYQLQTTEIESTGELIDASTDHAETEDEVEANMKLFDSLQDEIVTFLRNPSSTLQKLFLAIRQGTLGVAKGQSPPSTAYVTTFSYSTTSETQAGTPKLPRKAGLPKIRRRVFLSERMRSRALVCAGLFVGYV